MNPQMQGGYRPPYPQAQGRSPATRRPGQMPPGGPHPQQHPSIANQQHIQQQREIQIQHQLAQRRSKKPTDRNLPEGIEDFIIGDGVQHYKELREVEKKLDYAMMRKRLDVQDTFGRNVKRYKTMRIWISNTTENQPWQGKGLDENAFDFSGGEDPTFRVKIEGKLIDEAEEPEDDEMPEESAEPPRKRLSHFFRAISVEVERSLGDPMTLVDWKKQDNTEFDCLDFERKGDENVNVTISLFRDEQPERFRLSQALSQTLDLEEADRAEVLMGLWEYVKAMGLQEDEEKRRVRCDDRLKQIFGIDVVYFPQIPERIIPHLHPLPPVKLQYTIRVDPENDSTPTIYDVRVTTEDPLPAKLVAMTHNQEYGNTLRQIALVDDSLAVLIQGVQHSKAKHTFYSAMAKDPANFINRWMSSQQRDLEVVLGEATRGGGESGDAIEFARGGPDGVWGTEVVQEAVKYRLNKNPQGV